MDETTRATDAEGLEVLRLDECLDLIRDAPVGRVAFMSDGEPIILPVNHVLDGVTVAFRTAPGSTLDTAAMARTIAFEVDGYDEAGRTGWSVVVRGTAEVALEGDLVARLEDHELHPWADAVERVHWVVIRASEVTGRRIPHEPRRSEADSGIDAGSDAGSDSA